MLLTDGFGLHEDGEDVIQALVRRTTGPWSFGVVDGRGEEVIHVSKGVEDIRRVEYFVDCLANFFLH